MLDDMLDSVVKNLDSSSNAATCIIKLLYDLFVKQRQQCFQGFCRMKKKLNTRKVRNNEK